ncbi:hypothetical protein F4825DRAFT_203419 [Nemania diffusa]|nr:hypothetical protein F4825DRAFT_203419 [Nemania diffusa]
MMLQLQPAPPLNLYKIAANRDNVFIPTSDSTSILYSREATTRWSLALSFLPSPSCPLLLALSFLPSPSCLLLCSSLLICIYLTKQLLGTFYIPRYYSHSTDVPTYFTSHTSLSQCSFFSILHVSGHSYQDFPLPYQLGSFFFVSHVSRLTSQLPPRLLTN